MNTIAGRIPAGKARRFFKAPIVFLGHDNTDQAVVDGSGMGRYQEKRENREKKKKKKGLVGWMCG